MRRFLRFVLGFSRFGSEITISVTPYFLKNPSSVGLLYLKFIFLLSCNLFRVRPGVYKKRNRPIHLRNETFFQKMINQG